MTMSQCNAAPLSDRAVVRVSGPAAHGFLQGLITNDIDKAKPGGAIHAGLLTPQGKILFDFFVVPAADGFLLEIAKAKAGELAQRLGFYKLRAQVEIAEDPSFAVAAAWGAPPRLPDGAIAYASPRSACASCFKRRRMRAISAARSPRRMSITHTASPLACLRGGATTRLAMPFLMRRCSIGSPASISTKAASSVRRSCRAWSIAASRANASSAWKERDLCRPQAPRSRPAAHP